MYIFIIVFNFYLDAVVASDCSLCFKKFLITDQEKQKIHSQLFKKMFNILFKLFKYSMHWIEVSTPDKILHTE